MQFFFGSLPSRRVEQRRQRERGKRQRDPHAGRDASNRGGKAVQHGLRIGYDVGGGAPSPTAGAAVVEPRVQIWDYSSAIAMPSMAESLVASKVSGKISE